ncbi:MAG TPA: hypothetical protein VFE91_01020 [Nitrososphaerales archaeon]|nr:hypothetical protein [Nitrososphaerales archaeon]
MVRRVPLVYACVAPHGGEIIPAMAGRQRELFAPTTRGMRKVAKLMREARPDTIVVATPHNLRLRKHIGVVVSENTTGELREGGSTVKLSAKCDVELGDAVLRRAESLGLPVVGANYGALEGELSDVAMDWGTLVPLWFMLRGNSGCKVLIVTPSRGIPLKKNFDFGEVIAGEAEKSKKRVALVASADQAHAHRKDGPYGFSPRAREYDAQVQDAVRRNRLSDLMKLDEDLVEAAKPDSLWQLSILAGAVSQVQLRGELVSYQVPTYYGMLCATFVRT